VTACRRAQGEKWGAPKTLEALYFVAAQKTLMWIWVKALLGADPSCSSNYSNSEQKYKVVCLRKEKKLSSGCVRGDGWEGAHNTLTHKQKNGKMCRVVLCSGSLSGSVNVHPERNLLKIKTRLSETKWLRIVVEKVSVSTVIEHGSVGCKRSDKLHCLPKVASK